MGSRDGGATTAEPTPAAPAHDPRPDHDDRHGWVEWCRNLILEGQGEAWEEHRRLADRVRVDTGNPRNDLEDSQRLAWRMMTGQVPMIQGDRPADPVRAPRQQSAVLVATSD